MDWLLGIGFVGVIFVAIVLWEKLTERQDGVGSAARGLGSAAGTAGRGLIRIYGVALVVVGIFLISIGDGEAAAIAAGLAFAGYGAYLVLGGTWVIY